MILIIITIIIITIIIITIIILIKYLMWSYKYTKCIGHPDETIKS